MRSDPPLVAVLAMSDHRTPSPLMRLVALRGSTVEHAEATILRWTLDERRMLVRAGILHGDDWHLTEAGKRAIGTT